MWYFQTAGFTLVGVWILGEKIASVFRSLTWVIFNARQVEVLLRSGQAPWWAKKCGEHVWNMTFNLNSQVENYSSQFVGSWVYLKNMVCSQVMEEMKNPYL